MNTSATAESSQLDVLIQRINQFTAGGGTPLESHHSDTRVPDALQPLTESSSSDPTETHGASGSNCSTPVDRDEPFIPALQQRLKQPD